MLSTPLLAPTMVYILVFMNDETQNVLQGNGNLRVLTGAMPHHLSPTKHLSLSGDDSFLLQV